MKLAHERRQYMARSQVEVISWTIEIGRHERNKITSMLPTKRLALNNTGNLGHRVPSVRDFEGAGEQCGFFEGLRSFPGVDACAAQKNQAFYTAVFRSLKYIVLDGDVITQKICRVLVIGKYTSYTGCGQDDVFWLILSKKIIDRALGTKIQFTACLKQQIPVPDCTKFLDD